MNQQTGHHFQFVPIHGTLRADVWDFKETLTQCMGFPEENITIMIDTDEQYIQPTGKNIKAHLKKLVAEAADGDVLFVHFSGHGM